MGTLKGARAAHSWTHVALEAWGPMSLPGLQMVSWDFRQRAVVVGTISELSVNSEPGHLSVAAVPTRPLSLQNTPQWSVTKLHHGRHRPRPFSPLHGLALPFGRFAHFRGHLLPCTPEPGASSHHQRAWHQGCPPPFRPPANRSWSSQATETVPTLPALSEHSFAPEPAAGEVWRQTVPWQPRHCPRCLRALRTYMRATFVPRRDLLGHLIRPPTRMRKLRERA